MPENVLVLWEDGVEPQKAVVHWLFPSAMAGGEKCVICDRSTPTTTPWIRVDNFQYKEWMHLLCLLDYAEPIGPAQIIFGNPNIETGTYTPRHEKKVVK